MQVRPVTGEELPALLELIADYQRFYGNDAPDAAHNAAFFGRFIAPSERGMLIGAYDDDGAVAGYTCLYWTYSSVSASEVVLLNDLYVHPSRRSGGVGEALIAGARAVARERGASHLRWCTELHNRRAQRLYERVGADRCALFEYEFDLRGPTPSITRADG